ncbi:MAG: parallel beta-helix domain-containing protein [Gammaproteobacteria bacterium]
MALLQPVAAVVLYPGLDVDGRIQQALKQLRPGEKISLSAGVFRFHQSLTLDIEGLVFQGAGRDQTILLFEQAGEGGGILVRSSAVRLSGFSVQKTQGPALHLEGCTDIIISDVRLEWPDRQWRINSYLDEPVLHHMHDALKISNSQDILIESVRSLGALGSGISVTESARVLIRNSEARESAVGIYVMDSSQIELDSNQVESNGIGIFIDGSQATRGTKHVRIVKNQVSNNNNFNFAIEDYWRYVEPLGTGLVIVGGKDIEVSANSISYHGTANLLISAHDSMLFPDRVYIHNNAFSHSGYAPDFARAGYLLIAGSGKLASIVWDGNVPWQEMLGFEPRTGRVVLGINAGADFVDLDLPWYDSMPALHRPKRDYRNYSGSLRPLPAVRFISSNVAAFNRETQDQSLQE